MFYANTEKLIVHTLLPLKGNRYNIVFLVVITIRVGSAALFFNITCIYKSVRKMVFFCVDSTK